jgi:hypothetical protein
MADVRASGFGFGGDIKSGNPYDSLPARAAEEADRVLSAAILHYEKTRNEP